MPPPPWPPERLAYYRAEGVEWLAWLQDVSPFHYHPGGQPLRNGVAVVDVVVLLVASVVLVAIGGLALDRRDVAV